MHRIFKYTLPARRGQHVLELPKGTKILSIQTQHDRIAFWALVNPTEEQLVRRTFQVFLTGSDVPWDKEDEIVFLETLQFDKGEFVVHLFELPS